MNKFQSLFLGATMAATTMTAVAFAPSAASAITLNGSITFGSGNILGNPAFGNTETAQIQWRNPGTVFDVEGDFDTLPPITQVNLSTLNLTRVGLSATNPAFYNVDLDPVTNQAVFANFGSVTIDSVTDVLTFAITGGQLQRSIIFNGIQAVGIEVGTTINSPLHGVFNFGTKTIAEGLFSLNQNRTIGSGTVTLTATGIPDGGEPIPEPLTMGGLAVGAGFGAFLKKRYAKKEKQLAKA
jgi:hypothetical protein